MTLDDLIRQTTVVEELLAGLRGSACVFDAGTRVHGTYSTAFNGIARVEVGTGADCQVAVEHIGEGAFGWLLAEWDRRAPMPHGRWGGPFEPPTAEEAAYRSELFDTDAEEASALLAAAELLDWDEPTPETNGWDGIVLLGSLRTERGSRSWVTWSPQSESEPDKVRFFAQLLRFALDHSSGPLRDELALVERYV